MGEVGDGTALKSSRISLQTSFWQAQFASVVPTELLDRIDFYPGNFSSNPD
jgi:hypothetical protein